MINVNDRIDFIQSIINEFSGISQNLEFEKKRVEEAINKIKELRDKEIAESEQSEMEKERVNIENLYKNVSYLGLSTRAKNCLERAEIDLIGQLVQKYPSALLEIQSLGHIILKEIEDKLLKKFDLKLGMVLRDFHREKIQVKTESQKN